MKKLSRSLFAVLLLLFIDCSSTYQVYHKGLCAIDKEKHVTVHNLKYHCNPKQLKSIFTSAAAGKFPPNGKLNGFALVDGIQDQSIWNGKKFKYHEGHLPHDRGTLTNILFRRYEMFYADVYRTNAPVDGKEAFALNYQRDPFVFFIVDYIREIQHNVYLGIMTFRPFNKIPLMYFLLEKS